MENQTIISDERVLREKQARFNPIRELSPALLVQNLEMFKAGYLPSWARMWEAISERDDTTKACEIKRRSAVGALPWEVVGFPEAPKATIDQHTKALTYFWRNIEVTEALDQDIRGGFCTLIEQMAKSIGGRYSAHELLWRITPGGLTATFNSVPTWFFEARTGRLRYIPQEGLLDGVDLKPGAWMITVSDAIGIANSICYMFKTLPMRDWLIYCERHGMPIVQGKTDAAKGTPGWSNMKDVVRNLAHECAVVTGLKDEINVVDMTAQGQLPYPPMVDRMDRGIATLWRGADLSTISAGQGQGQGASLQGGEGDYLLARDAQIFTETLRRYVDRLVIQYIFGEGVEPAAGIQIQAPPKRDNQIEIAVDRAFFEWGIDQGVDTLRERYNRPAPAPGEPVAKLPEQGSENANVTAPGRAAKQIKEPEDGEEISMANERFKTAVISALVRNTGKELRNSDRKALEPIMDEIDKVFALGDPGLIRTGLRRIRATLPVYLQAINRDPLAARIYDRAAGAALVNGMAEGAAERFRITANEEHGKKVTKFEVIRDASGQIVGFDKVEGIQ